MAQVTIPNDVPIEEQRRAAQALNNLITAARKDVDDSYDAHSNDVRMLSIYGMFYNGIGDAVSAEKVLSRAHELSPNKQLISFDLVKAYLLQNKMAQAYTLARETYDLAPKYDTAAKVYLLSSVYTNKWNEAVEYVRSTGGSTAFDMDILNAMVSAKQTSLAIQYLNDLKKTNPEYASQVDAYIKQLLAKPAK
jgi:tetratricopeptide (TPR) repeat protein